MKTCFVMVGLPGSGKTTWRNTFVDLLKQRNISHYVISTDEIVEKHAEEKGIPYAAAWRTLKDKLENILLVQVVEAVKHDVVIWDQTNLTMSKRRKIRGLIGKEYNFIAVDFFSGTPMDVVYARNNERKEKGRSIATKVIQAMNQWGVRPTFKEGYSVISHGKVSEILDLLDGDYVYD
jgi:tRNA uridine 5-carbamoylmethylation protein Kti12